MGRDEWQAKDRTSLEPGERVRMLDNAMRAHATGAAAPVYGESSAGAARDTRSGVSRRRWAGASWWPLVAIVLAGVLAASVLQFGDRESTGSAASSAEPR